MAAVSAAASAYGEAISSLQEVVFRVGEDAEGSIGSLEGDEDGAAAGGGGGRYCVGAHLSLADIVLIPQMYNARRFDVDLTPYPTLCAVDAHCATLPIFAAAHPDAQPDAIKTTPPTVVSKPA